MCERHERIAQREEGSGRKWLGAKLNERCAPIEERAGKIGGRPSRPGRRVDVDYRVQRATGQPAYALSASDPVAFGARAKRSMNAVLSFPATKSGSAMIFRCSGTVVLMPSMTVISSVRRILAIAS